MKKSNRRAFQIRIDVHNELMCLMKEIEIEENRKRMQFRKKKLLQMTPTRFSEGILRVKDDLKRLNWEADLR